MKANIANTSVRLHIEIVVYPDALVGLAMELVDLLRIVNTLETLQNGATKRLVSWQFVDEHAHPIPLPSVSDHWDAVFAPYGGAPLSRRKTQNEQTTLRACFVPPFHTHNVPALRKTVGELDVLANTVKKELNKERRILSIGNAAWFAAGSVQGMGRTFAVPWFFTAAFMTDFSHALVAQGDDTAHDGPFISGGSPRSLSTTLLLLLGEVFPVEFINTLKGLILFDPQHHATVIQTRSDGHVSDTSDSVIAIAIAWLDQHLEEPYDLASLSRVCAVSTRTLLRHFAQVMHMTPLQYLHAQRCKRACYLLESKLSSVQSIAQACGYTDVTAFRKIFIRHVGTPPLKYRQQRSLRAPRARWKVENVGAD